MKIPYPNILKVITSFLTMFRKLVREGLIKLSIASCLFFISIKNAELESKLIKMPLAKSPA